GGAAPRQLIPSKALRRRDREARLGALHHRSVEPELARRRWRVGGHTDRAAGEGAGHPNGIGGRQRNPSRGGLGPVGSARPNCPARDHRRSKRIVGTYSGRPDRAVSVGRPMIDRALTAPHEAAGSPAIGRAVARSVAVLAVPVALYLVLAAILGE